MWHGRDLEDDWYDEVFIPYYDDDGCLVDEQTDALMELFCVDTVEQLESCLDAYDID